MAIPDFQSIMLPLLEYLGDNTERSNQEIREAMEQRFALSEEEKRELIPSGRQPVFKNRLAWAKSYFKRAGLLQSPQQGVYGITPRGLELLAEKPERITIKLLMQYPEFKVFREGAGAKNEQDGDGGEGIVEEITPREMVESGYRKIVEELAESLLESVRHCSPRFFERLVMDVLLAMGYGGGREAGGVLTAKGADSGIDGVIAEDRLGLESIYVQAKRWEGTVGRPEIQKFCGALHGERARKGIFITTSDFSKDARAYAASIENRIVLVDGRRLAALMVEYNVGVSVETRYDIKRMDSDYFLEE
jgi:restriction system protein